MDQGLIKDINFWITRKYGCVNFHLTQMRTGHGCFPEYLHRFKRLNSPACHDCQAPRDDVEHSIFRCDRLRR